MNLKILLPYRIFAEKQNLSSIVAETAGGSFGILPQRLDCVAVLSPGILSLTSVADGTQYIAMDGGVLIKTGNEVRVSSRRVAASAALASLHDVIKHDYLQQGAREIAVRTAIQKLESGLTGRLKEMRSGR